MTLKPVRLLDANIILRFLRKDDPEFSQRAKTMLTEAQMGKQVYYVDEVTIAEVVWVLVSVYKTKRIILVEFLEAFMIHDWILSSRKKSIFRALALYRTTSFNYIDCWLLAVSEEKHIPLETFDQKLKKLSSKI